MLREQREGLLQLLKLRPALGQDLLGRCGELGSVSNRLCVSSVPDSEVAGACRCLGEERT